MPENNHRVTATLLSHKLHEYKYPGEETELTTLEVIDTNYINRCNSVTMRSRTRHTLIYYTTMLSLIQSQWSRTRRTLTYYTIMLSKLILHADGNNYVNTPLSSPLKFLVRFSLGLVSFNQTSVYQGTVSTQNQNRHCFYFF